jgi:hypothetical protein
MRFNRCWYFCMRDEVEGNIQWNQIGCSIDC